jgi:Dolichyl-phosphate-mannose-protein mannosyltransferase
LSPLNAQTERLSCRADTREDRREMKSLAASPGAPVSDVLPRVERLADRLACVLERRAVAVIGVLTAIGLSVSALAALRKPFWHDEIVTILVSRLPLRMIWAAGRDGVDFFPPLTDVVTHGIGLVFGVGPIVTRLPAIASFWATSLIVFAIVRRRSNTTVAATALLLPCLTEAFQYSYEARGYALMLALFAASLFAWSEAARGHRRELYLPLLAILLAAGMWNHYFAVLSILPLAAGELMRVARSHRPDWPMYASILAGGLLALPLAPLMYAAAYGSPSHLDLAGVASLLPGTYQRLIGFLEGRRFQALFALVIALGVAERIRRGSSSPGGRALPGHEIAAGLTCLLIPAAAMFLGAASGAIYIRYALPFVVGLAIVGPLLAWWLSASLVGDVLVAVVVAVTVAQVGVRGIVQAHIAGPQPVQPHPLLGSGLEGLDPIVLTDVDYLQTWYYEPPESRSRLWYIADPVGVVETGTFATPTMDRNLLALRRYAPVGVTDYSSFVRNTPRFLLFSRWDGHWLPRRLSQDGGRLTRIGGDARGPVFEVVLPTKSGSAPRASADVSVR